MSGLALAVSILAALGGLSGVVALVYVIPTYKKLQSEAKKAGAEASQVVAQGATILLQPLQQRVTDLDAEVVKLRTVVKELEATLDLERRASQEERRVSQQMIRGLKEEVADRDKQIVVLKSRSKNGTGPDPSTGRPENGTTPPQRGGSI